MGVQMRETDRKQTSSADRARMVGIQLLGGGLLACMMSTVTGCTHRALTIEQPQVSLIPIPLEKPSRKQRQSARVHKADFALQQESGSRGQFETSGQIVSSRQLIGLDMEAVRTLMGTPSRIGDDGLSREWIYARQGCDFSVFFYPALDGGAYRALKYSGHSPNDADIPDSCMNQIVAERKDASH